MDAAPVRAGRWYLHGATLVRIDHIPTFRYAMCDVIERARWHRMSDEQQSVAAFEGSPPYATIIEQGDGSAMVVPDRHAIEQDRRDGDCIVGEDAPRGWPWPCTRPGVVIEVNDHGNTTALYALRASRVVPGDSGLAAVRAANPRMPVLPPERVWMSEPAVTLAGTPWYGDCDERTVRAASAGKDLDEDESHAVEDALQSLAMAGGLIGTNADEDAGDEPDPGFASEGHWTERWDAIEAIATRRCGTQMRITAQPHGLKLDAVVTRRRADEPLPASGAWVERVARVHMRIERVGAALMLWAVV